MKNPLTTVFLVGFAVAVLTTAVPLTSSRGTTTSVMELKQYSKPYPTRASIPFIIPHSRPYPAAAPKPTSSSTAKAKGIRLTTVRVCKNADLTACRVLTNTVNICRLLTAEFGPAISSVVPGPDVICYLYQNPKCLDLLEPKPLMMTGLSSPRLPSGWNDKAQSIQCLLFGEGVGNDGR
ncbi:hypothetical protein K505DRAFT_358380 [Melanomma pulvis-pyrius CBS 109.77]|uniref:Hydrophobin n=1 Tax=Melanomma pulvis-pyrius CBS 109.77 TaxID=1314802 RepID=A0A6A6XMQ2_9PLEO|nr:hypothetical protein K505DRAFT_358380 [Melanomma pulvis-pyrius CBS 109.77]